MRAQGVVPKPGVAVSGYPFRPAPALLPAVITLVYLLCTLIPPTYDWRMRSQIHRRYKGLQAIEDALKSHIERRMLAPPWSKQVDSSAGELCPGQKLLYSLRGRTVVHRRVIRHYSKSLASIQRMPDLLSQRHPS